MVLTKDELLAELENEVRIWLHLISKITPENLNFRPTPKQRSILELVQYLTVMAPVHTRGVLAETFDMEAWGKDWTAEESIAKNRSFEEAKAAIAGQPAMLRELLGPVSDERLRSEIAMFGAKASRGSWLVTLLLCHYSAYRMQLFQYLKFSGREELNTINLWVGRDTM